MHDPTSTLLENASAICSDSGRTITGGHVLIRGSTIAEVADGPYSGPEPANRIDMSGCIVVPGLVNVHHHFFQTVTRAIPGAQRGGLLDWLSLMYPLWSGLDEETVYWAALASAAELMLTGATTTADAAYLLPERDGELTDAEIDAVRRAGIRFHFVRGCMPTMEGNLRQRLTNVMGENLSRIVDDPDQVFRRMDYAIGKYHDTSEGSMLRVDLGPTGITYEIPGFMRKLSDFAAANACGLHTHLHPRPDERDYVRTRLGSTPLDILKESGWLREGTWLAHGTQLTEEEMTVLADRGVGLAHCPRCVMRLGLPATRIGTMRARGMRIGIGVDGGASNDCGAMINEVRLALLLHRVDSERRGETSETWLEPRDVIEMATEGGAALLRRPEIGRLAPGMRADIAAFRIDRVGAAGAVADPVGALLLAASEPYAALTMIDGHIRVRDGRLVDLNETEIAENANRCARRLLRRAKDAMGLDLGSSPLQ